MDFKLVTNALRASNVIWLGNSQSNWGKRSWIASFLYPCSPTKIPNQWDRHRLFVWFSDTDWEAGDWKPGSQIFFPYKEELSVGKMKFAAAGDNDLHLFGDLRYSMGGLINGGGQGLNGLYGLCSSWDPRASGSQSLVVNRKRHTHTLRNEGSLCGCGNLSANATCKIEGRNRLYHSGFHTYPCSSLLGLQSP